MSSVSRFLRRIPAADKLLAAVAAAGLLVFSAGLQGGLSTFATFVGFSAGIVLLARLFARYRQQFLWSLRNRLLVAYVFIAVVPMILMAGMVGLSAYIGYTQLAAYLIYQDVQERLELVAGTATVLLDSPEAAQGRPNHAITAEPASTVIETVADRLPGLRVRMGEGDEVLKRSGGNARHDGARRWLITAGSLRTLLRCPTN